jgi:hypothetical protein
MLQTHFLKIDLTRLSSSEGERTKISKATKGADIFDHKLRITMLQDLRARRKSYDHTKHLGLGDSSRQGAKSAKFG